MSVMNAPAPASSSEDMPLLRGGARQQRSHVIGGIILIATLAAFIFWFSLHSPQYTSKLIPPPPIVSEPAQSSNSSNLLAETHQRPRQNLHRIINNNNNNNNENDNTNNINIPPPISNLPVDPHSPNSLPSQIPSTAKPYEWCYNCSSRCDNVVATIQNNAAGISQWERAYKFKEMAASLPRFFRGVDHLYLEDVFNLPRDSRYLKYTSHKTRAFVDGDMHLYNYGSFDNSYGQIIYDMNDFDEVLIDNYQVDLYRTATSLVVHMRINGISKQEQDRILTDFARIYYETVRSFVGNDDEITSYLTVNNTEGAIYELLDYVSKGQTREKMLDKWCYLDHNRKRLFNIDSLELQRIDPESSKRIHTYWPSYLNTLGNCHRFGKAPGSRPQWIGEWTRLNVTVEAYFHIKSIARRLGAGLGSLGTPRFYVLIEGPSLSQDDDIILDVKFEGTPSWYNFVHEDVRWINGFFTSEGHRISSAMHALLSHVDTTVGYMDTDIGSFIIRPRSPYKDSVDVDALRSPIRFHSFAVQLATINAINHARSDNDYSELYVPWSFEEELTALVGDNISDFSEILREYAYMNADRITEDYACYLKSGIAEKEGEGLDLPAVDAGGD